MLNHIDTAVGLEITQLCSFSVENIPFVSQAQIADLTYTLFKEICQQMMLIELAIHLSKKPAVSRICCFYFLIQIFFY